MLSFLMPILAFGAAWGLILLTPGTETALIIRLSLSVGHRAAIGAVAGIVTGVGLWGFGTIFGVSAIISASKTAFTVIQWAGALYLLYLSLRLIWQSVKGFSKKEAEQLSEEQSESDIKTSDSFNAGFRRGSLTTLLNPLVGVFDMTAFPHFIPVGQNAVTYSFALVFTQMVTTLFWYSIVAGMALSLGRFFANPKIIRILDMITGIFFLFFAAKLVLI
ncbi:LysE family translocator [Zymomonas mobilis]|uniref:LysE family translocator n=1 Tax=Zymomonas mobilis TaxID=542 RepID=UPI0003C75466|nr:LysE family translocator [Zymomonas mobilis]AHB10948.1 putative threonine efflux protein [Zymomonas mobilis subsp. mobilis str. CP4 = NRRL B-14023]AHJ71260.1 Leucine efflux protein [Zymomonas mobilis subsp. mobilis NRRL B-12526]AHJ73114.1 Leucine efflux protein [Zymomonas mobilis subsp. mobilis str. CP4 = NRRL B-14023]TWE25496.1 threonine/homoserine/homoserine lactone efflux protein [Zymomonas mobilis]